MPGGLDDLVLGLIASVGDAIAAGAAAAPFETLPGPGYVDFPEQRSCDPEFQEGAYSGPEACVCYDDGPGTSSSAPDVDAVPAPVTGDRPSSAPRPAGRGDPSPLLQQKAGGGVPADADSDAGSSLPTLPLQPIPLVTFDIPYATVSWSLNPISLFGPIDPAVQVDTHKIVRDVFDLNPADGARLPDDDIRQQIEKQQGLGQTLLKTAAKTAGWGDVSDALGDLVLDLAQGQTATDDDDQMELERRTVENSIELVIELLKVLIAEHAAGKLGPKTAPKPTPKQAPKGLTKGTGTPKLPGKGPSVPEFDLFEGSPTVPNAERHHVLLKAIFARAQSPIIQGIYYELRAVPISSEAHHALHRIVNNALRRAELMPGSRLSGTRASFTNQEVERAMNVLIDTYAQEGLQDFAQHVEGMRNAMRNAGLFD